MKKLLAVMVSLVIVAGVFAACSSSDSKKDEDSSTTQASTQITTDEAKIKESDAVNFIKEAYTKEELGLDDVDDEYSFMVGADGVEIEDEYYIKVAANVMTQSDATSADGKKTYNLTPVGEYYISYDGEKVLMKDLDSGKYKKLENKYQDYKKKSSKSDTTSKSSESKKTTKKSDK